MEAKTVNMKPVKGFDGYFVDEDGNVFNGKLHKLKPCVNEFGYLRLQLYSNGTRKNVTIHRIVAETFLDNPNNYKEVNHKDENKTNNSVSNLEWCTSSYNKQYGTGRKSRSEGMKKVWDKRYENMGVTREESKIAQKERHAEKCKERYLEDKTNGTCVRCRSFPAISDQTLCEKCAEQNRIKTMLYRRKREQASGGVR